MKTLILVLLYSFFTISRLFCQYSVCSQSIVYNPSDANYIESSNPWQLVFEDNFNGNLLNLSKWNLLGANCFDDIPNGYTDICDGVVRFPSYQWYSPNNIVISNGTLKIISKREDPPIKKRYVREWDPRQYNEEWFDYTSAEIDSKLQFSYGRYEIRCKIPNGQGFWPAFWTFGVSAAAPVTVSGVPETTLGSQVSGEIDCFEFFDNQPTRQTTNIHTNDYSDDAPTCYAEIYGDNFTSSFHTFSIVWTPAYIEWWLADQADVAPVLIRRVDKYIPCPDYSGDPYSPFHYPENFPCMNYPDLPYMPTWYVRNNAFPLNTMTTIIANTGMQTNVDLSALPGIFEIDYIRYYQQRPCNDILNLSYPNLITTLNNHTTFHTIQANNINISNASIGNGQQLKLNACNEIVIDQDFDAFAGSDFEVSIDNQYCCTQQGQALRIADNYSSNTDNKSLNTINNIDFKDNLQYLDDERKEKLDVLNTKNEPLKKINSEVDFIISPNPNSGMFNIQSSGSQDFKTEIINTLGEKVYEINNQNKKSAEINISYLPKGMYLVKIICNNNTIIRKVIIN